MTTFNNALLSFAQRSGAVVPVDPAQSEPDIVTIGGQRRRITVMVQVNGQWEKIDPTKLRNVLNQLGVPGGQNALQTLAESCHKIYGATGPANASSFTVYLGQSEAPWSLTGATLGRVANRFKDAPPSAAIIKIEYKTDGSDKTQTIELKDFALSEGVSEELTAEAQKIAQFTNPIFTYRNHLVSKKALPTLESRASTDAKKLQAVKRVLNVQEAGSRENRCATLSIASILLKKNGGSLQDAADEFDIPLTSPGLTDQITLSNGLIELAARTIATNGLFTRPDTQDNLNGHFSSIVAALKDARQNIADETDRKTVVEQYATLIRQPGQLLDIPVFEALTMHGIPFITLVPFQGDLVLGSVSNTITFNAEEHSLDTYDLTTICFVVRDGLHYQPVMMSDTPNVDQLDKLRSILKNDMEKTLVQIQNLITDSQRTSAQKSVEFNQLVGSVINKYPIDAKPRIVQMLRDARRTIDNDLISTRNDLFIEGSSFAFLSNPGPIIEEVD